jgi:hypothetical protein
MPESDDFGEWGNGNKAMAYQCKKAMLTYRCLNDIYKFVI